MDFEPTQTQEIEIGRLLRASTAGFVVGCRVTQLEAPAFGALVRAPLLNNYHVYGIIHDIRIEDDGLVRQLITAEGVDEAIIADNRMNRNVPVEISVLALGYRQGQQISHLLPPQPPPQSRFDLFVQPGGSGGIYRRWTAGLSAPSAALP